MNMRPVIGVVIPALDPPEALSGLVGELRSRALGRIVVVNDGSADRSPFRALEAREEVTVLHDEANRGKGEALKTGFHRLLASEAITKLLATKKHTIGLFEGTEVFEAPRAHERPFNRASRR